MILKNKIGYSYDDVTIVPEKISSVSHREECDCLTKDNMLPIFTAPMTSIVNYKNYKVFENNNIIPIIPRSDLLDIRKKLMSDGVWVALSLSEFKDIFIDNTIFDNALCTGKRYKVCIDIANGHMQLLYDLCVSAQKIAMQNGYFTELMVGNIANPETYKYMCELNEKSGFHVVSYVRCGIGGGSGCITSSNTGIHYPQASLIDECHKIKAEYDDLCPYIIADGGIRNYCDVTKALALGADYVMIGGLFASMVESANVRGWVENKFLKFIHNLYDDNGYYTDYYDEITYDNKWGWFDKNGLIGRVYNTFFGMASKEGQLAISGQKTKTSEGISKNVEVTQKLPTWAENMKSYLKSTMSYCNCTSLAEFIGDVDLIVNSSGEQCRVNK